MRLFSKNQVAIDKTVTEIVSEFVLTIDKLGLHYSCNACTFCVPIAQDDVVAVEKLDSTSTF